MKFFKFIFWVGVVGGIFYLANTVPFNGKSMLGHLQNFWNSGVVQEKVVTVQDQIKDDWQQKIDESHKNSRQATAKAQVEEYTQDEQKIITDTIGNFIQ